MRRRAQKLDTDNERVSVASATACDFLYLLFRGRLGALVDALLRFVNALQPYFSPPSITSPRAKHPALAEARSASSVLQNDGWRLKRCQATSLFVDKPFNAIEYTTGVATVSRHLGIEGHSPIHITCINSGKDLRVRFDPNQFSGLQVEVRRRLRLTDRDHSASYRGRHPARKSLKFVIEAGKEGKHGS
ncbi:MAG: hypothetical protein ACRD3W_12370, partial [Terriglobales bacterium]